MKRSFFSWVFVIVILQTNAQDVSSQGEEYVKLAELQRKNGKADSAIFYYDKAVTEFQNPLVAESYVNACNQIGIILTRQDKYEKAREYLNKALSTGEKKLDQNHELIATTYLSIGVVDNAEEKYAEALINHNKALEIRLKKLGENHPDVATSYGNIGNVHLNSKNYEKAIEAHFKAMQVREKVFGKGSPEIIESYKGLGNAYKEKKDYPKALEYYELALKNKITQRGEGHKDLIKYYNYLSETYYLSGNTKQGDFYKNKAATIK